MSTETLPDEYARWLAERHADVHETEHGVVIVLHDGKGVKWVVLNGADLRHAILAAANVERDRAGFSSDPPPWMRNR